MAAIDLLKGFSVVIDDQVNDQGANIQGILRQINDESIPFVSFESLPEEKSVGHFRGVSFVLLDWWLKSKEISEEEILSGAKIPDTLRQSNDDENIEFIRMLVQTCFCPIFIFTNEDQDDVVNKLVEAGLYVRDRPNQIFVKSKRDVNSDNKLFDEIEQWLEENPSIYVLKEWEREYHESKNRLFYAFHALSPVWPCIMWKTIGKDGGNKSLELGELIMRNLQSRMMPFEFDSTLLEKSVGDIDRSELRVVLEGERYLTELHPGAMTGDVFAKDAKGDGETGRTYRLNIRAQCDLIRDGEPQMYCIGGKVLLQKENGKITDVSFNKGGGEYAEKVFQAIVPFVDGGKIIEFSFRNFEVLTATELKESGFYRIGCLLPPYITKIQQRFALYIQRQGLPRIPEEAIFSPLQE